MGGRHWEKLAEAVGSKTVTQIKNYYYDHKKQFVKQQAMISQNGRDSSNIVSDKINCDSSLVAQPPSKHVQQEIEEEFEKKVDDKITSELTGSNNAHDKKKFISASPICLEKLPKKENIISKDLPSSQLMGLQPFPRGMWTQGNPQQLALTLEQQYHLRQQQQVGEHQIHGSEQQKHLTEHQIANERLNDQTHSLNLHHQQLQPQPQPQQLQSQPQQPQQPQHQQQQQQQEQEQEQDQQQQHLSQNQQHHAREFEQHYHCRQLELQQQQQLKDQQQQHVHNMFPLNQCNGISQSAQGHPHQTLSNLTNMGSNIGNINLSFVQAALQQQQHESAQASIRDWVEGQASNNQLQNVNMALALQQAVQPQPNSLHQQPNGLQQQPTGFQQQLNGLQQQQANNLQQQSNGFPVQSPSHVSMGGVPTINSSHLTEPERIQQQQHQQSLSIPESDPSVSALNALAQIAAAGQNMSSEHKDEQKK